MNPFDVFELDGFEENPPLVELEATMQEAWFLEEIIPLYYEQFPIDFTSQIYIPVNFSRNATFGFPPSKALGIEQIPAQVQVRFPNYASGYFPLAYSAPNTQLKYLIETFIRHDQEALMAPCLENIARFEQFLLDVNSGVDHHDDTQPEGPNGYTLAQLRQLATKPGTTTHSLPRFSGTRGTDNAARKLSNSAKVSTPRTRYYNQYLQHYNH